MNTQQAVAALNEFGTKFGVATSSHDLKIDGDATFEDVIHYFPDSSRSQAWINRMDNGGKCSIGLNFRTGNLTYGYAKFEHGLQLPLP